MARADVPTRRAQPRRISPDDPYYSDAPPIPIAPGVEPAERPTFGVDPAERPNGRGERAAPQRIPPRTGRPGPPTKRPIEPPRLPPRQPPRPPPGPVQNTQSTSKLLAATGSIAIATLLSRITGFFKQAMFLTVLGPLVASSYTVASVIPNMISEFVLGAVLTAIVVPVLVRAEREDDDQGAAFVRRLFTAALTMLVLAAALATAAAPVLTSLFLASDGKGNIGLTTALLYLLLPAIMFYGLSALFTAILNTRQNFKPGAWAPVLNNVVVLIVLVVYLLVPGDISLDPTRLSDPKLLVLGLGVTAGVVVQVLTLVPALRRNHIDLRPLWGLDARLKQFGGMAVAIILYVMISQVGMIFATRVSSTADVAGPAIYNNAWLLLQLPYGVLGVTLLTAIMPRLSRNAAAKDTPAVVDDLSVATRLTMLALIPVIGFLTVAGPQVGQALYGYGNFGSDAGRLGEAVSYSAFTLIPYSLVLIHLRVFYAREQAWTPTYIVIGITSVKIALSALAPVLATSDRQVVLLLGVANGLGYTAGAVIGWMLLRRSLADLKLAGVQRTVGVVLGATVLAGAVMYGADRLLGLNNLTSGAASLLRVAFDGALMMLIVFATLYFARIPEIVAVVAAVNRKLGRGTPLDTGRAAGRPEAGRRPTGMPEAGRRPTDPTFDETDLLPVVRMDSGPRTPRNAARSAGSTPAPPSRSAGSTPAPPSRSAGSTPATSRAALPYPGPRRAASDWDNPRNGPADDSETTILPAFIDSDARHSGEGAALTDDEAAGGRVPSETGADTTPGGVSTDTDERQVPRAATTEAASMETAEASDDVAVDADRAEESAEKARESTVDTGMIATGAPALPPMGAPDSPRAPLRGPQLIPGASVAGGRYRLLAPHGGARGLKFWQAHDVKLDREVALTFVDADQRAGGESAGNADGPQAVLSRTLRLGRINSPGLARVLDVVRGSSGGIVVAEWTRGRSLREMAETVPSPIGAANAIKSLAAAAEAAHRGGGALSIDHPDRVRISTKGDAVLAFPATLGDADPGADVRGLGAMLYALITARWPLGEPSNPDGSSGKGAGTVGGMALADRTSVGAPVEPRAIRPDVPFEISAVAVRALEQNTGIRTAATVQHILGQAAVVNEQTEMIPALRLGQRAPGSSGHALADPEDAAAEHKKSNLMIAAMVGLGAVVVIILGLLGWWIANFFTGGSSDAPLTQQNFGLTTTVAAPAAPGDSAAPASPSAVPIPIASVEVFSPQGSADNPGTVDNVLDNNPSTVWDTDSYFQPFPSLKNGVGVLATLDRSSTISSVYINSPSPGTVVEIRSATSSSPTLDQTQVIGSATLTNGLNDIVVRPDGPVDHVLFWITDLSTAGGNNRSTIADIGVTGTN
ncbi:lipid II flippase MurJ [Actinomycetes bacterium M1A6_2h]